MYYSSAISHLLWIKVYTKKNISIHCLYTVSNGKITDYPKSKSDSLLVSSQVARKIVDVAIGGDQGGSIRVPASFCGIVGLKPTYGLVPYTGIMPIEMTFDHAGPMARTVEDCATLLEVKFKCL